jgi:hypothetical protein
MNNFKKYYREILIGILIALLLWVGSKPIPSVPDPGYICITDTLWRRDTVNVPNPTLREWRKIYIPVHDTIYAILSEMVRDTLLYPDTAWLYTDVPVHGYTDSIRVDDRMLRYDLQTIGWLDSISWSISSAPQRPEPPRPSRWVSVYGDVMVGRNVLAPGVQLHIGSVYLRYNQNLQEWGGTFGFGYKIR